MEIVYQKIVDTFNAHPEVFTDHGLPAIRTIDINMGQPEDPENWEVFCPAIFISWDIKADNTANGDPDTLYLDFHVLQDPGSGSESFSGKFDEGIEYLKLLKAVKYCLNRLSTDVSSPLKYVAERQAVTPYFRYHVLQYSCSIDSYEDSIWRTGLTDATIEKINLTGGVLRKQNPEALPDIEVY